VARHPGGPLLLVGSFGLIVARSKPGCDAQASNHQRTNCAG